MHCLHSWSFSLHFPRMPRLMSPHQLWGAEVLPTATFCCHLLQKFRKAYGVVILSPASVLQRKGILYTLRGHHQARKVFVFFCIAKNGTLDKCFTTKLHSQLLIFFLSVLLLLNMSVTNVCVCHTALGNKLCLSLYVGRPEGWIQTVKLVWQIPLPAGSSHQPTTDIFTYLCKYTPQIGPGTTTKPPVHQTWTLISAKWITIAYITIHKWERG